MLINSHFQYLVGGKASAISILNAPLLVKTNIDTKKVLITDNYTEKGAAIYATETARMRLLDLEMTENTGSCIELSQKTHILIEDSIFRGNEGSVLKAAKDVILDVLRSTFELNVATNGAILHSINNKRGNIQFRNSFFGNIYS